MFGTVRAKLDSNGRLAMPLKHLQEFNSDSGTGTGHGILVISEDGCIEVFSKGKFGAESERNFPNIEGSRDGEVRERRRGLLGNAYGVDIDERGRFSIPSKYREYANLSSGSVILTACGDYIEIWAPARCPKILLDFLPDERSR